MEWQFKETMQGCTSCVDGCNACGSQNDVFFLGGSGNITQESRFTRPRFTGEEKRTTGKLYDLKCIL